MSAPTRPVAAAAPWAASLFSYGVTGTNGKTSSCAFIAACLRAAGRDVLRVGTTGAFHNERELPKGSSFADFLALIEGVAAQGVRDLVIEATSFALHNGYAKKWRFDLGVFTNLSPDHLKTHGTWENYLAAKAQLFLHLGPGRAMVLNAADHHASFIDRATPSDVRRLWFRAPSRGEALVAADLEAAAVTVDRHGTQLRLAPSPLAEALGGALRVRMIGEVFAENALAAAAACLANDVPAEAVARGLADCPVEPGRFELLAVEPMVVVDYAHSPDALARTCATARTLAQAGTPAGRVVLVFGAGGNSTPEKRAPMGAIAARVADHVVVTNDNPRREDPQHIAAMIVHGARSISGGATLEVVLDRREAIERAIAGAARQDVVVIAGMGHEQGQRIGDTVLPFSDRDEVLRITGGA
jgi:UDP-N-acetylmuramoyl-L-alanyl-D-glutamate--2,6-diaminopimelate ligase